MTRKEFANVDEYLSELPHERRQIVEAVRKCILENLPAGYEEAIGSGMICYQVPLTRFAGTYNGQPLMYAALAIRKDSFSLHLMTLYWNPAEYARLQAAFRDAGKKLDLGKACVRFRKLEDLPLEAIARVVAGTSVDDYLAYYEASRRQTARDRGKATRVKPASRPRNN